MSNTGQDQSPVEPCGATHGEHVCTLAPHRPEIDHTEVAHTASGFPYTVTFWKSEDHSAVIDHEGDLWSWSDGAFRLWLAGQGRFSTASYLPTRAEVIAKYGEKS
jgi:hypothetical protein